MSKYNLTDIFEEMSTAEKERFDRLSKDDQDKLKKIMDMMAKEKSMKEDKYDDIVDADDDIPANEKKATAAAYRKVDKGASYEKATSHIKEVTSRESSRMEGLVDQRLKAKFLDIFADLYFDLTDEDPFQAEDVVDYLGIEMLKHLDAIQAQGDRLNSTNTDADFEREQRMQMDMREEEMSLEDIVKSTKVDGTMEDLEKAVMAQAKKSGLDVTDKEVEDAVEKHADMALGLMEELAPTGIAVSQKQLDDLKKRGAISGLEVTVQDKDGSNVRKVDYTLTNTDFEKDPDDIDFVNEDLKNHFGRFMKDYQ